jgi:hypothetical protein
MWNESSSWNGIYCICNIQYACKEADEVCMGGCWPRTWMEGGGMCKVASCVNKAAEIVCHGRVCCKVAVCRLLQGRCPHESGPGKTKKNSAMCFPRSCCEKIVVYRIGLNLFTLLNVYACRFVKALKYKVYWHKVLEPLK